MSVKYVYETTNASIGFGPDRPIPCEPDRGEGYQWEMIEALACDGQIYWFWRSPDPTTFDLYFDLYLRSCPPMQKIKVIKRIREITQHSLAEAKGFVEIHYRSRPFFRANSEADALGVAQSFESIAPGLVEIRPVSVPSPVSVPRVQQ